MTTPKKPGSLEAAIAEACGALGGFSNAEMALGVKQTTFSAAANPNKPDGLRCDLAARLDEACAAAGGGTPIGDWFEDQAAHAPGPGLTPHAHLSRLVRRAAQASASLIDALEDGALSKKETRRIFRDLDNLEKALEGMRADLEREQ